MKGIIKLVFIPEEKVKTGMTALYLRRGEKLPTIFTVGKVDRRCCEFKKNNYIYCHQCRELVIETKDGYILLRYEDWEKALNLIYKEVDFRLMFGKPHVYLGRPWAKLWNPLPMVYTEKEVITLLKRCGEFLHDGFFTPSRFKTWWNKNKKK